MGALAGYGFSVVPTRKVKVITDITIPIDIEVVKPDIFIDVEVIKPNILIDIEVICKDS